MHIPLSVYRLQFNQFFGFSDAKKISVYLKSLGISDLYASPIFKACAGSMHGYDIIDPLSLNSELGTQFDFEDLMQNLKNLNISWVQDIVPNHMAFNSQNQILMDVLEYGASSKFYNFFDINWQHAYENINGKLLTPFLGKFYAEALENMELKLEYSNKCLNINYYELSLPLRITSYTTILGYNFDQIESRLGHNNKLLSKLRALLKYLADLNTLNTANYNDLKRVKQDFWDIYTDSEEVREFVCENIRIFNGQKGNAESFNLLDNLLCEQMFCLSFWKVATEEINYRRFFNINALICLKQENKNVFDLTHQLIFEFVKQGKFSGLRVDHIDGLYDPAEYLTCLRQECKDTYIVVEKILEDKEKLPRVWPVQGTTGYDFLNYANGIFCKRKNQRKFNRIYIKISGIKTLFEDIVCANKRLLSGKHMAGDISNLAYLMKNISSHNRYGRDITLYGLKRALVEIMAHFPVYRTYFNPKFFNSDGRKYIQFAVKKAKHSSPGLFYELDLIEKVLLLEYVDLGFSRNREELYNFVCKFQQLTGPLMAKGVEDTVYYVYNRFLSLNEVGSSPAKFGVYLNEFHNFNKRRKKFYPHTLNTLATHDTKRGEDLRARLNVLSEIPLKWETSVKHWHKINKKHKIMFGRAYAPDKNDEYFLYQTIVGALPFSGEQYAEFVKRLKEYLVKAVREAKVHTAWLKHDVEYENAFLRFAEQILNFSAMGTFLESFLPFQRKAAFYGIFNSLSQTLLKITAPGVPDFYQGTELWDFNLVDPDNRRPVDFALRQEYLSDIKEKINKDIKALIIELWQNKEDGRLKLFLVFMALQARNQFRAVFEQGNYIQIEVCGRFKDSVIAFARNYGDTWILTIVPRFLCSVIEEGQQALGREVWQDTSVVLPETNTLEWTNLITSEQIKTGKTLLAGEIFSLFPCALLCNK
ncbi:MAG: malto-oligosyltrehalose synthase [Candidatus Omnitrophota bacterium]|nr:MAG: malto-oligosyltrehalose synthase [Candidatus Omnitrophota bacterium]